MKITTFSFLFSFFLLFSCKKTTDNGIFALSFNMKGKYQSVTESGYEYTYKFIPLETKDEALLSKIFCIKKYDNYLYIHSIFNKAVMIFSSDGKFIKKISIGRGPEEILDPVYIAIDEQNKQLEILDFFRQIKKYTLHGHFIESQDCHMCSEFEKSGDNYLFHSFSADNPEYCFGIQKSKGKTNVYINAEEIKKPPLMAYSHIFKADTTLYFHTDFNDTVYAVSPSSLIPYPFAILNNLCTANQIKSLPESEIEAFCTAKNLYLNMLNFHVLHNGSTIYAEMITANDVEPFLYNIENRTIYRVDNGLDGCIVGYYQNCHYKYITPSQIEYLLQDEGIQNNKPLYEQLIELSSVVQEEDNPIIVEIQINKKS